MINPVHSQNNGGAAGARGYIDFGRLYALYQAGASLLRGPSRILMQGECIPRRPIDSIVVSTGHSPNHSHQTVVRALSKAMDIDISIN
jgi:hypothetical protein